MGLLNISKKEYKFSYENHKLLSNVDLTDYMNYRIKEKSISIFENRYSNISISYCNIFGLYKLMKKFNPINYKDRKEYKNNSYGYIFNKLSKKERYKNNGSLSNEIQKYNYSVPKDIKEHKLYSVRGMKLIINKYDEEEYVESEDTKSPIGHPPIYLYVDLDFKGDDIKDLFVNDMNKDNFKEAQQKLSNYLLNANEVILAGPSASGKGFRWVVVFDTDIMNFKDFDYDFYKKSWDDINKDILKSFFDSYMDKLNDEIGIKRRIKYTYVDDVSRVYNQMTFNFGYTEKNRWKLYKRKLSDLRPLKFNYYIHNKFEKKVSKNQDIILKKTNKEFVDAFINKLRDAGLFKENKVLNSFKKWFNENMYEYNFGTHNVILGMLVFENNNELWKVFYNYHRNFYKQHHTLEKGGMDDIFKTLKSYQNYAIKVFNENEFYPLTLKNFVEKEKYLNVSLKNEKESFNEWL